MKLKDFEKFYAEKAGVTQKDAKVYIEKFVESIQDILAQKDSVTFQGFGKFEAKLQKGRTGTIQFGENKGKEWTSEDKYVPNFKASKNYVIE
jgi:DNA-binding protein HU-beta